MKILLFGKNGQVGWELNRSLQPLGEVVALARDEADFSSPESLRKIVRTVNPDVIVNAVAYTAVDKAEAEEELAATINGVAPEILAEEALSIKALLIHYSTDYVFDGTKDSPYVETDATNPINAYGRTKLAGEVAIQSSGCDYLVFRTSWVYASRGKNFLMTILKLAQEKTALKIVSDQVGSPTSARLVAESTLICAKQAIINRKNGDFVSGTYHLTASDKVSWHGFAEAAIQFASTCPDFHNTMTSLLRISTEEYGAPAKRPLNSCLSTARLSRQFAFELPCWRTGLQLCVDELYATRRQ